MVVGRVDPDALEHVERALDERERDDSGPRAELEDPQRTLVVEGRQEVVRKVENPAGEEDRRAPGLDADRVV